MFPNDQDESKKKRRIGKYSKDKRRSSCKKKKVKVAKILEDSINVW
jgi:hypothetical protein